MFTAGVCRPVPVMPGLLGDIVALTPLGAGEGEPASPVGTTPQRCPP